MGQHESERRGGTHPLEDGARPLEAEAVRRVKREAPVDRGDVEAGALELLRPVRVSEADELGDVAPARSVDGRPERATPPARSRELDRAAAILRSARTSRAELLDHVREL